MGQVRQTTKITRNRGRRKRGSVPSGYMTCNICGGTGMQRKPKSSKRK